MQFSIIIPVYNSEKYIIRCIGSVKSQTLTDFECILVDDGSTDNSKAVISDSISNDPRFSLYSKPNAGVSSARNFGLSKALGTYVLFIDADDWIEPALLETINAKQHDEDVIQFDFYKTSLRNNKEIKKAIHINSDTHLIMQGEGAVVWKRAFKRSFITGILFDESLKGGEDYLFCSEVFLKKPAYLYIDACLYDYNVSNTDSAMSKKSLDVFSDQLTATRKVIDLLNASGLYEVYENDVYERYFWCLAEFNNWWLCVRNRKPLFRKVIVKLIKILLKW